MTGSDFFTCKKPDLRKARIFSNTFRFIDDLYALSNEEFENNCNDIYPDELRLKKENEYLCKTLFLDLSTEVRESKFIAKFCDNRDAFSFNIKYMSNLASHIPSKIFILQSALKFDILPGQKQI